MHRLSQLRRVLVLLVAGMVISIPALPVIAADPAVFEGPVPRAACGGTNDPFYLEPALQGEVTVDDRVNGRSQLGYRCNLELAGHYNGQGAGWQNTWYGNCDYYDTKTNLDVTKLPNGGGNGQTHPGTQVIDVSDPAHPIWTTNLDSPALDGAWESLKVNQGRGLLAGVGGFGSDGNGPLYFDVYDVGGKYGATDCAHPKRLFSGPAQLPFNPNIGHEGNWAQDGRIYYATSIFTPTITAIDVTDPLNPRPIMTFAETGAVWIHGLSTNKEGTRLYTTQILGNGGNGLTILDTSLINQGIPVQPTLVGQVNWSDGAVAQHTIPISYNGHPYIYFVDEGGAGTSRIIDIGDEKNPKIISKLKLEIHMPNAADLRKAETGPIAKLNNTSNGGFGYEGHYCAVDTPVNPTAVACGYFQSGIRVFDIRDPYHPREIAYYNPPARTDTAGKSPDPLPGSEHWASNSNMTTDWCSSQIRFNQAPDGTWMLWAQCQDNGFMTLRFTNGVYPLAPLNYNPIPAPATSTSNAAASPATAALPFSSGPRKQVPGGALLVALLGAAVVGLALNRSRHAS